MRLAGRSPGAFFRPRFQFFALTVSALPFAGFGEPPLALSEPCCFFGRRFFFIGRRHEASDEIKADVNFLCPSAGGPVGFVDYDFLDELVQHRRRQLREFSVPPDELHEPVGFQAFLVPSLKRRRRFLDVSAERFLFGVVFGDEPPELIFRESACSVSLVQLLDDAVELVAAASGF